MCPAENLLLGGCEAIEGSDLLMLLTVPDKLGPGPMRLSGWCQTLLCPAGIAVCIGMASTFAYANSTLREQVSLKVSHLAS